MRSGASARRHVHCATATASAVSARTAAAALGSPGAITAAGLGPIATTFGAIRRARPVAATIS
jgi:hypothetical protein